MINTMKKLSLFTQFAKTTKSNSFFNLFNKMLMIVFVLFITTLSGCEKEDVGKCTIKTSSGNIVIDNISLEKCQLEFGETIGATGWKWEPKN